MTRVLGVPSPWSGDEHDPIPWTYRKLWYPTYLAARRVRHRLGLHDWKPRLVDGGATERCDWCGSIRPTAVGVLRESWHRLTNPHRY